MADAVVLDTSAFLTLTGEEPGADTVQKFITDAFVAATAQRHNATLVHKDPEFDALNGVIKLHSLPPKATKK